MRRRIVSVWLPRFDADLVARRQPIWREKPLAFYREAGGKLLLTATNAPAAAEGVTPGMALADARALISDLATIEDRPARRVRGQAALRRWLDRFTPLAALDGEDGFFLDVTGAAHLFDGEAAFLAELLERLQALGFAARVAIADSPGAAWALARHGENAAIAPPGETRAALEDLPAAALRLSPGTAERLRRLGLATIGDLVRLPRPALVRRFGVETVTRLDQALAVDPEPIAPLALTPEARVQDRFAEPLIARPGVEVALDRLIAKLIARLDRTGDGALELRFEIRRLDGGRQTLETRAAEATRDAKRMRRLFHEKLDAIDPGFGIESASLAATATGPLSPRQIDSLGPKAAPDALSRLIDTLGNRLGFDSVARFQPRDSWLPERSYRLIPAVDDNPATERPSPPAPTPGPRPLFLLKRPQPIRVDAGAGPLDPPVAINRAIDRAGGWRKVLQAWGPERIAPEWRAPDPAWPAPRDYWRAEEEDGGRLWLYRQGDAWFLHGFFP